jgi:hypothetical protein
MSLLALLVEGNTDWIFMNRLLPYIQLPDKLFVSRKLTEALDNRTHENRIWLQDCGGDRSIPTFIRKNIGAFLRNDFNKLVVIRDYFPDNRPPTHLCKKDLCNSLMNSIPSPVVTKYSGDIFINLSVEEIEAWFFADKNLFEKMIPTLTEEYINTHYDNIFIINPETIRHPSAKLKNIIRNAISGHTYNKTEKEAYFLISRIDMNACLSAMERDYIQSFYRMVNYLLHIL